MASHQYADKSKSPSSLAATVGSSRSSASVNQGNWSLQARQSAQPNGNPPLTTGNLMAHAGRGGYNKRPQDGLAQAAREMGFEMPAGQGPYGPQQDNGKNPKDRWMASQDLYAKMWSGHPKDPYGA